ncbi:hypothetical protein SAVIM338S_07116 [Streptomyces avidinii]
MSKENSARGTAGAGSRFAVSPRLVTGVILVGLAVWFVLINTRTARIHFWIPWVDAPMWFVLAVTFMAGAAAAWLLGRRKKQ